MVVIEDDGTGVAVTFKDEWEISGPKREQWYHELRKRLIEHLQNARPDVVVISDVEPMALMQGVSMKWFETAEVRGVLIEAVHAAGCELVVRALGAVTRVLNPPRKKGAPRSKPASEFLEDDGYWAEILKEQLPKKYRKATLFAISSTRQR